jgi:hypothetical protein
LSVWTGQFSNIVGKDDFTLAGSYRRSDADTVTKSDRFLEGHSKFPPQSQKTFVSDTGKNFTLSKAFFLRLLSGKLFHSGECAFFHL